VALRGEHSALDCKMKFALCFKEASLLVQDAAARTFFATENAVDSLSPLRRTMERNSFGFILVFGCFNLTYQRHVTVFAPGRDCVSLKSN
jgi:hypothetical protein